MWNNPLNATDPSGFILDKVLKATGDLADGISSFVKNPGKELVRLATYNYMGGNKSFRKNTDKASRWIKNNERTLTAIAVTAVAFAVPATAVFAQSFWGSVALGAVNGYITSGGDLKATLIGAVSGGGFNGIGTAFGNNLEFPKAAGKVLAHGVAGGLRSAALGGNFEDGFRSSAISQTFAVSGAYKHIPQDPFTQAAASSTVGGVTSELTGGSFEDGAITGLYSHMLNDMAHQEEQFLNEGEFAPVHGISETSWSPIGELWDTFVDWAFPNPDMQYGMVVSPSILKLHNGKKTTLSRRAPVKKAQLPLEGKVRYVPPKNWKPSQPLPKGPNKGFIDKFGNEWTKGPSRTKGQSFEWDVQRPDGTHWNISLDGKVTH